jgi:cytochrome c553
MRYDKQGRQDPNGHYEMRDGKLVSRMLQPGEHVTFSMAMMDGASPTATASSVFFRDNAAMFTDAEHQLFNSDEGRNVIAYAKMCHRTSKAWMGDRAPEFTDAQAAEAIKKHVAQYEAGQRAIAEMTAKADQMQRDSESAYHRGANAHNDWRR